MALRCLCSDPDSNSEAAAVTPALHGRKLDSRLQAVSDETAGQSLHQRHLMVVFLVVFVVCFL